MADAAEAAGAESRRRATPASWTTRSLDYLGAMNYFATSDKRQSFIGASRVITAPVDAAKITAIIDGRVDTELLIDSMGGAVASLGKRDTAFWHRDALATIQVYASATMRDTGQVTQSANDVVAGLAAAGATGAYVNYIDPALPNWMNAYFGDNATRLRKVAQAYDPNNAFHFAQGVQSERLSSSFDRAMIVPRTCSTAGDDQLGAGMSRYACAASGTAPHRTASGIRARTVRDGRTRSGAPRPTRLRFPMRHPSAGGAPARDGCLEHRGRRRIEAFAEQRSCRRRPCR